MNEKTLEEALVIVKIKIFLKFGFSFSPHQVTILFLFAYNTIINYSTKQLHTFYIPHHTLIGKQNYWISKSLIRLCYEWDGYNICYFIIYMHSLIQPLGNFGPLIKNDCRAHLQKKIKTLLLFDKKWSTYTLHISILNVIGSEAIYDSIWLSMQ